MNDRIDRVKDDHKDHGADNIKVQVNKRCTSRIFGGADTGKHCSHTCSDILSHDDRKSRAEVDCSRCT